MSGCLMWTLLCVSCMAGYVTGQLHEPSNVTVESRNLSLFLTWLPAPENPSTVTYEVEYTNFTDDDVNDSYRWTHVPVCKNISVTQCDFTCALKMWDLNHSVRVRSILSSRSSSWVQIPNIQYLFTVDPDPPILTVTQGDGFVTVNTSAIFPLCLPQIIFRRSLSYFVVMMKNNNPNEFIREQELDHRQSITMITRGYKGEYCVAAKTKFITDTHKLSKFSNPVCFNVTKKDESYHAAFVAGLPIFTIIAVISFISFLIWHNITEKSKTPKALDFSDGKYGQKNPCLPKQYAENFCSLNIYEITEQDTSTKLLIPNKHDDGVNIYPIAGQGYMERPTMQNSSSHSKEYFSSKDLAFNSSSDKSSSGCTCPNTSGSVTGMASKDTNDQTTKIQITVSDDGQMFSSTSMSVSEHIDSVSILDHNSLANIPLETLCIGGIIDDDDDDDDMDISDGESSNQCLTDSDDGLDSLSTDFSNYKMSDFNHPSQDEKLHKDCISDYTQRTYTSKRC